MSNPPIDISRVQGDVVGAGVDGNGNFVAKHMTIHGDVIQLTNPTPEAIAALQNLQRLPTTSPPNGAGGIQASSTPGDATAYQKIIDQLLGVLRETSRSGRHPQEIEAGGVHLSRVDLLLKKAILLKGEAEQMYFDHLAQQKEKSGRSRSGAPSGYTQVDLREMFRNFDEAAHRAKLNEGYQLLREANALDPTNTEVLLNMAQLLIDLTPDDSTDEERLLFRIQNLLVAPKDDVERFRLAQATFLLATRSEPPHMERLKDARQIFDRLGRREWVRQCDDLLGGGAEPPVLPRNTVPPSYAPPPPAAYSTPPPAYVPPPPAAQVDFVPHGRWKFQITDGASSVMVVDFYPNGTFGAVQHLGPFAPTVQAQGQWLFNPYNQTLQLQGLVNGFQPFMLGIAVRHPHLNGFFGNGSDGYGYFISRE